MHKDWGNKLCLKGLRNILNRLLMFKKGKDEEGMKIVFEFQTKKGWSVLVDLERCCTREISFEIPTLSKSELETLLNISDDLKNHSKHNYYLLFSPKNPIAVSTFNLCRLKDIRAEASSEDRSITNLKCFLLDGVDYTEMESSLNEGRFWRIHGLILKSHRKVNLNEIKEVGIAYLSMLN